MNQSEHGIAIFDAVNQHTNSHQVKNFIKFLVLIHSMWRPIISRMKDYIANPKPNMYQSLHTTVIGPDGEPLEIQMRTWEMHKTAEFGIAAHWKYKEGKINTNESDLESKLAWLRQMMEWQKEISDPQEFMQSLKMDLFANEVYVFTPRSEVIELPAGAVPLDFAYKVHSEVGNKAVGAKVNGRIVPQTYKLQTGDIVEILTSSNSNGPSRDWLNIVQSSHAKNKIRQWFKKERRDDNIKQGKEMFERELRRNGFSQTEVMKQKYIAPILKSLNLQNEEDMYNALGYGGVTTGQIIPRIRERYEQENKESKLKKAAEQPGEIITEEPRKKMSSSDQGVRVKGHSSILIRFAKCCNPLPGDEIVGYVTKGRGVSIHRADCENIDLTDEIANAKLVEVEWNQGSNTSKEFDVEVNIQADDRRGLFVDVSKVFSDEKIMVNSINARTNKESIANMYAGITVSSKEQLKTIMNKLKRVDGVISVTRV